jgi:small subunit ribosomal protein S20
MPLTASAKKALRAAKRKQVGNYRLRAAVKRAVDKLRKGANEAGDLAAAYTVLDRAAKRGVVHNNKAARLKSRLNKLVKTRLAKTKSAKPAAKKAGKKA